MSPLVAALDVDNGSVFFLVPLCSLRLTIGPRCSASWLVWTRRTVFHHYGAFIVDSGSGMCRAGFRGYALSAVFLPVVVRPEMLATLASMDQRDSYAALVVVTAVVCAWLVFLVTMLFGHHGAHGQGRGLVDHQIPQFVVTVADFPVVRVVQILRCRCGEDIRAPTVAAR